MTRTFLAAAMAASALAFAPLAQAGDAGKDPVAEAGKPGEATPTPDPRAERAPPRRGADLLRMFHRFCRDTHAGAGAVIAAAERDGYREADNEELKTFAVMDLRDLQVRARSDGDVRLLVGAAHGRDRRLEGQRAMDVCIVSISPGGADAAEAFGGWVGVEPVEAGTHSVFMYLEGPTGRQSIASAPGDLRRRMRDGDLQLLMVGDEGDSTIAIYGVTRPEI